MNLKKIPDNLYFIILSIITLSVTIYSYLKVVVNDDIHIYFGVARAASFFGAFPENVDLAWETRPIGNRLVFYTLYKIFEPLYGNEFLFNLGTKGVVAIVILVISWYFARQVIRYIKSQNIYACFLLTSVSLLALHIMFLMETEWIACILAILAIALLLSDSRYANVCAGIVMLVITLLKFVTIVFIPVIIAAWVLIANGYKPKKIMLCLLGFELALLAFTLTCIIWFKNFFSDLFLTVALHNMAGWGLSTRLYQMLIQSLSIMWFMPVLIIGLIAGVIVFFELRKSSSGTIQIMFCAMWACPIISIFIQSEFFLYHYTGLIIPSVISVILLVSRNYSKHQVIAYTIVILSIISVFGATCSVWQDTHAHIWDDNINNATIIKERFNITDNSVLYLDTGTTAYFLGAPGACRYTYPLVIRRGSSLGLTNTSAYLRAKMCIMEYNGEYIVSTGPLGDIDIDNKITTEYTKVYGGTAWSYKDQTGDLYQKNVYI